MREGYSLILETGWINIFAHCRRVVLSFYAKPKSDDWYDGLNQTLVWSDDTLDKAFKKACKDFRLTRKEKKSLKDQCYMYRECFSNEVLRMVDKDV